MTTRGHPAHFEIINLPPRLLTVSLFTLEIMKWSLENMKWSNKTKNRLKKSVGLAPSIPSPSPIEVQQQPQEVYDISSVGDPRYSQIGRHPEVQPVPDSPHSSGKRTSRDVAITSSSTSSSEESDYPPSVTASNPWGDFGNSSFGSLGLDKHPTPARDPPRDTRSNNLAQVIHACVCRPRPDPARANTIQPVIHHFIILLYYVYEGDEQAFFKDFGPALGRVMMENLGYMPSTHAEFRDGPKAEFAQKLWAYLPHIGGYSALEQKELEQCWAWGRERRQVVGRRGLANDEDVRRLEKRWFKQRFESWTEGWRRYRPDRPELR
jgi:hypothetical protein